MTIKELHDKFYIEYDKANSITTYPNFTHYEIDAWFNKALLMLISQKFTGSNARKIPFEGDPKRLSDLQILVVTSDIDKVSKYNNIDNMCYYTLPSNFLNYVGGYATISSKLVPADLIEHEYIKLFMKTDYNRPWLKRPKVAIEDGKLILIYDSVVSYNDVGKYTINYVKSPNKITYGADNFQFTDTIAEELINLAVMLALGNIESQKFNTAASITNIDE